MTALPLINFLFEFPCIINQYYIKNLQATDLGRPYWIYITPIHDMHQWLLLQFLVLLMMDAESVRNIQSDLAVTNKQYCQSCILLVLNIIYQYIYLIISRSIPIGVRNVSDKTCRENQNSHFMFNNIFRKSCRLWDMVEKYGRARQVTDDKMVHEHFILGTLDYKHTLSICNTLLFPCNNSFTNAPWY